VLPFIPFHLHYFPVDAWLAFGRGIFGSVLSKSAIGEKFITFRGPPALVDWFGIPAPFPSSSTAVPSEPRIPSSSASRTFAFGPDADGAEYRWLAAAPGAGAVPLPDK